MEFAHAAKSGDVVFVTAAAGSVGSTVVQIAKAEGLKVIASAGSEDKTAEVLEKEGPINIYWDNVGGESLEAALEYSAQKAHFIICGSISNYNTKEPYNVKNLQLILWREVTLHGFLVLSLESKYADEFFRTFPARVASGEIKYKEHRVEGLEHAGQAIFDVQSGKNTGKMVVVVANE
ncbi:hypothetical protein C8Q76DRAFT_800914 [Earliella scabrosa]|nr:hypothetical protein C8Q76DRAFT_800914 [Earliella scabrosa]